MSEPDLEKRIEEHRETKNLSDRCYMHKSLWVDKELMIDVYKAGKDNVLYKCIECRDPMSTNPCKDYDSDRHEALGKLGYNKKR